MFKFLKNNLGFISVLVLNIIPLLLWLLMKPVYLRFSSPSNTFRSLGQITGLLGMVLLSINFVLAARFKFLDKLFNGLNRVYIKHHLIGAISFCLLLFHPVFLTIQYLFISLRASFEFLSSVDNLGINLGKLSLFLFIALMVITFYLKLKYKNWKNTHKYLGIVLFLGGLHMLFVPSDISNNIILKYYMIAVALLGAFAFVYRTILGFYKKEEYKYKLKKVIKLNDSVVELILSPISKKIKFTAGQFVFLRFEKDGVFSESHPFSITSCEDVDDLSFGIKALGDDTSKFQSLEIGLGCIIEGPFGVFSYKNADFQRQVWIAGGIGITPFLGMARQINCGRENKNYNIDLFYSVKNNKEAVFAEELDEISKQNNNFKFQQYSSEDKGYISANAIMEMSGNIIDAAIFLCGPAGFMKSLRKQFVELGFDNNKIYSEEFSL